jgi:DNA processing protein
MSDLLHQIALACTPGIGPVSCRLLLSHLGSARAVFEARKSTLLKIPDIGRARLGALRSPEVMKRAEAELKFIEKNRIRTFFITEPDYPERLRQCADAPVLLFARGELRLNHPRIVSIVGTRAATSYGKQFCEMLIQALAPYRPVIVSGLAYGIDICAHRAALRAGLPTFACLAHGLDRIYPGIHAPVAHEMIREGGLLTEFFSGTRPDRELFPMRNRIIAGIADCTVVVETDERGGSMITADLAHGYGREVFALPGRHNDPHSQGCNLLIRKNVAALLSSEHDLADYLGWNQSPAVRVVQPTLFDDLSEEESRVADIIRESGPAPVDLIVIRTGMHPSGVSSALLSLEFRGMVISMPGKVYRMA